MDCGLRRKRTEHTAVLILSPSLAADVAGDSKKHDEVVLRREILWIQPPNDCKPLAAVNVKCCAEQLMSESRKREVVR